MSEEKKDKAEYELDLASDCDWVRALDASGKPIRISKTDLVEMIRREMPVVSELENGLINSQLFSNIPFCGILSNKQLILLSKGTVWERQLVTIAISHSGSKENSFVVLSADVYENNQVGFKTNIIGIFPSSAKLLYRVDNGTLYLYLYGDIGLGSYMGLIIQSQKNRPVFLETIDDISGYTTIM